MGATPLSVAAERNKGPILEVLKRSLPLAGQVLEIASGTGQHVLYFAAQLPHLVWQPTERAEAGALELDTHRQRVGLANVRSARVLDVLAGSECESGAYQAVVCINMVHIAPVAATDALFAVAARALAPDGAGIVVLYGPFKENGRHTAPSNEAFDESLRERNPEWDVRDLEWVALEASRSGFTLREVHEMPANNRVVVFARA